MIIDQNFFLTLSQTSPGFYVSVGKGEIATMFSTRFKNFMPFSSNLKLSSANSYNLEKHNSCRLGKGYITFLCCRQAETKSRDRVHIHISSLINHFPNKPWFLRICRTSLLKTLWEKEKLLATSNFSFSNSVFYTFGELYTIFIKFKLSSAKSFSFEESKICCLGKGQRNDTRSKR